MNTLTLSMGIGQLLGAVGCAVVASMFLPVAVAAIVLVLAGLDNVLTVIYGEQ